MTWLFLSYTKWSKYIKRCYFRRLFADESHQSDLTQKELNTIFENMSVNLAGKYAYVGKIIYLGIFYAPILPIGLPICLCGLTISYIVEKYNVTNYYKKPAHINGDISLTYFSSFKVVIFLYALGNYIFTKDIYIRDGTSYALIGLIVFSILQVIPYDLIFMKAFISDNANQTYEENYLNFMALYDVVNPMTKKSGTERYLETLKEKGIISNEEYLRYLNDMNNGVYVDLQELYHSKTNYKFFGLTRLTRLKSIHLNLALLPRASIRRRSGLCQGSDSSKISRLTWPGQRIGIRQKRRLLRFSTLGGILISRLTLVKTGTGGLTSRS